MVIVGRAFAVLLVSVLLTGCGLVGPLPGQDGQLPGTGLGTPAAASPSTKPLASTLVEGGQEGNGGVSGQLQRLDGTPLKAIFVYAAPVDLHGGERLASVDPLIDLHAETDAEGRFDLSNLKPGEYALATQSPLGIILPHDNAGKVVTFTVAADQETSLGIVQVGYMYPDGT